MMDIPEAIRKVKTELRLFMNGATAAYMRDNGMDYKLNFGVEIPRLREIAAAFPPDSGLAQALWEEDTRECKLLAAMLMPVGAFRPETAEAWMRTIPNAEIARHIVHDLFSRLPYALRKAYEWMADEGNEMSCLCGFLVMAHLFTRGFCPDGRATAEFFGRARTALHASFPVRRAATSALQKYAMTDGAAREEAEKVLREGGI